MKSGPKSVRDRIQVVHHQRISHYEEHVLWDYARPWATFIEVFAGMFKTIVVAGRLVLLPKRSNPNSLNWDRNQHSNRPTDQETNQNGLAHGYCFRVNTCISATKASGVLG